MANEEQLLEYLKKVTIELNDTRARLREARERAAEPIAIVGIGCRYPGGADSAEQLWELVAEERDAISEFPNDRGWDRESSTEFDPYGLDGTTIRHGGFLERADEFDPAFFGIGVREALAMDPQQRLLLETSWEAIEHAGIDPLSLRGSRTGVFAGILAQEYGLDALHSASEDMQVYLGMSSSTSMLSGRISYVLGLEGPAVTINTACSSSLVALHLACQALRAGDCDLALASGVTVNITPTVFVQFGRVGGLAQDGRCKSFAASADGTGLSEGVGVLLLERLSDATRRGHDVLCLIRGGSVNQDGASNGITAPNGLAQQRVIRQALANAGLTQAQVDAVEAHGTGTELGDPIEAEALLATYGQDRVEERPLWLGSIKSNIGHAQAAAGIAGVIKMAMAMRHGVLPKTLHVDAPSGKVEWSTGVVSLLTESRAWPAGKEPRRAGVSSFGVSGTNAHVILEEAPPAAERSEAVPTLDGETPASTLGLLDGDLAPWPISGRDEQALRDQAERLRAHAAGNPDLDIADLGFSLVRGRSAFEHRAVVVGERDSLLSGLAALASGEPSAELARGTADAPGRVAFVFPGQGSQWEGMAVELLDRSPVFAACFGECVRAFDGLLDWSLEGVLRGSADAPGLERIDVVQPALFAVIVSLAGLWRACGVKPAAVVGQSQGEIAAAYVAGALSLEDAARIVAVRSRLLVDLMGRGGVVSVAASLPWVRERLERWEGRLAVAGINGPRSVGVAGDNEALRELVAECEAQGVRAREVAGTVATHSPSVEPLREELLEFLSGIRPRSAEIPFHSTVTGERLDGGDLDECYWYRNVREPVRLESAVRDLIGRGFRTFVEISPHPVLSLALQEIAGEGEGDGQENERAGRPDGHARTASRDGQANASSLGGSEIGTIGSLHREQGGAQRFLLSLGEAWARGVAVDWTAVLARSGARRVALPTYAFKHQRYWLERSAAPTGPAYVFAEAQTQVAVAPLLGELASASPEERESIVLDAVREQLAAVIGDVTPQRIEPDRPFLELGLDSVSAIELSSRLGTLSGLRIPRMVVFDHRTPRALASHLCSRLDRALEEDRGDSSDTASSPVGATQGEGGALLKTVESLLGGEPFQGEMVGDFLQMLMSVSSFRPRFGAGEDACACPELVDLAHGAARPALICLPSVMPMSGPHEYVRLAKHLAGDRDIAALPVPGFLAGERVPESVEAVVEVLAQGLRERFADEPFVLAGHSSGGMLAYALAGHFERSGVFPVGVIAMDTYMLGRGNADELTGKIMSRLVGVNGSYVEVSDARLTAMGRYLRLLAEWQPPEVAAPTLLLRALDTSYGIGSDVAHGTSWGRSWTVVEVAGDHFSMMDDHADSTARAVEEWIGELTGDRDRAGVR